MGRMLLFLAAASGASAHHHAEGSYDTQELIEQSVGT